MDEYSIVNIRVLESSPSRRDDLASVLTPLAFSLDVETSCSMSFCFCVALATTHSFGERVL